MTQDQLNYQKLQEDRRHNFEMEQVATEEIEQKRRATAVSEEWYNEQMAIKQRETDVKEQELKLRKKQFEWQKSQDMIGNINHFMNFLITERDKGYNRAMQVYSDYGGLFQ